MKKKILGAVEAIQRGVKEVIFADARMEKPVSRAIIGKGTIICGPAAES
jgi:acetylglutamate/LysW-gamma-L-alpha-aminoadipate kinase